MQKSFEYKAKLLRDPKADEKSQILNNAKIAVPLKYFCNVCRSFKMLLINCKTELKLKWTKYCVLSAAGADNTNANTDDVTFTISDTNLFSFISKRQSKSITHVVIDLKDQFIVMNMRQKMRMKILQMNKIFSRCNRDTDSTRLNTQRYYLPKSIINNYNVIVNRRNFYDQTIDSDIKRYEEIGKLKRGQSEDYTTGCLLDNDYIKSPYRLIAVGLSTQKEL